MKPKTSTIILMLSLMVLAAAVLADALSWDLPSGKSMEYSRITIGGGLSNEGRFRLHDSITLSTASGKQTGTKYEIDAIAIDANNGIATAIGCDQVLIVWTRYSLDGAVEYRVLRSTSIDGDYEEVASVGLSTTMFLDETVDGGTTYYYMIVIVGSDSKETPITDPIMVTTSAEGDVPLSVDSTWEEYE